MSRFAAIFSLSLLVATSALADSDYDRETTRQFESGSVSALELENLAGRILLERAAGDILELRARVHAKDHDGMSAREVAQLLDLEIIREGGKIIIRAKYPVGEYRRLHYDGGDSSGFFSGSSTVRVDGRKVKITTGRKGSGLPLWVDFQLRVPAGTQTELRHYVGQVKLEGLVGDCRLDCASADISAEEFEGELKVDTGSGDITIDEIRGSVALDTGSGDIKARDLLGDFHADTGSGDILLREASGSRLHADTGSGDVILKDASYPQLNIDTGSGDVKVASLLGALERWKVDTGSGDVVFLMPQEGVSFHLEVDTGSGEVDCELASSELHLQRGKIRSLTVGGGDGLILVDTGSGDVSILQRND
jgi:DUF4097 and DUF4098 domain-containing protein YvlB